MEKAILANDIDALLFLLKEGHNPNGQTEEQIPYLFLTENEAILKLLVEYGADLKTVDESGFTVLDYTDIEFPKPKNTITLPATKFVNYRETKRSAQKRSKTRRAPQSHVSK
jgi:hypothetical protein